MHYVVGVAGPPGGGKTTLARELVRALPEASAIHMDSYETMTDSPMEVVRSWVRDGVDIDAFDFSRLAADLERLKRGHEVAEPGTQRVIAPAKYIVFETQFGRAHRATGAHIDLLLWLETPLDVALARTFKVQLGLAARERSLEAVQSQLRWLQGYTDNYLGVVRSLVEMQLQRVRPSAEIVLDGLQEPASLAREAARAICSRLS